MHANFEPNTIVILAHRACETPLSHVEMNLVMGAGQVGTFPPQGRSVSTRVDWSSSQFLEVCCRGLRGQVRGIMGV